MDIKLYDLPLSMIQPFQDTGSLELEETEGVWVMLLLVQLFLFKEVSVKASYQHCVNTGEIETATLEILNGNLWVL